MTDGDDRVWDVRRYEQLRSHALDGEPSAFRLGLALLERRGVTAWVRAWGSIAHPEPAPRLQPASATAQVGDALVSALASMALARVAAG